MRRGTPQEATSRPGRRRWPVVVAALVGAVVGVAGTWVAWEAVHWGAQLEEQEAMLPGTRVAGVDVSGLALSDAAALVQPPFDEWLAQTVTVVHADRTWTTSPRDLDARTDLDQVLTTARDAASLPFVDLVRMRWLGASAELDLDVEATVPAVAVEAYVTQLAEVIDKEPVEAELRLVGREPQLHAGASGAQLEREEATARLLTAVHADGDRTVQLPVTELVPTITTELVEAVLPEVRTAVDAALDRPVRVVAGDRQWTVTARELDAVPDLTPAIEALTDLGTVRAVASSESEDEPGLRAEELEVPLQLADDGPIAALVEQIAAEIEVPVRDARLGTETGWVEIVPERSGTRVEREPTAAAVRQAVLSGGDEVEVQTARISPGVTRAAFQQVLLVRQGDRRVYLYEDGQIVRNWPAAIGTSDYPTPTGRFRVGAKRFEPTWTNPSPDDWGYGAPASIGPGPSNPLGPRAINWNRPSGRDSLIRFHGTPDERTIGQAATHGCIRMYNADVIELYDLVQTGSTIVSVP
jgi:lipoprotein-anchoring transpeptidase ErfK/SrfK